MNSTGVATQVLLVIGWRDNKRFKLGRVDTKKDITDYLGALASAEEERLKDKAARAYSVESTIEKDEYFVAETVDEEEEKALRAQLRATGALPLITVDKLEKTSLSFYAVVVEDAVNGVKAFIKKTNPLVVAKGGGLLAVFGDALSKLEEPVFAIADSFDLVVYPEKIAILREKPFQALFYEETGIDAKIETWVNKIAEHLPMDGTTKAHLVELCRKGSRLRQKLHAIEQRGHLSNVTIAKFRNELKRLKIPVERFVNKGHIIVPQKHEKQLLEVLNEDLFEGGFSGEEFAAERKSRAVID